MNSCPRRFNPIHLSADKRFFGKKIEIFLEVPPIQHPNWTNWGQPVRNRDYFFHAVIFSWEENIMFSKPGTQTNLGQAMGFFFSPRFWSDSTKAFLVQFCAPIIVKIWFYVRSFLDFKPWRYSDFRKQKSFDKYKWSPIQIWL